MAETCAYQAYQDVIAVLDRCATACDNCAAACLDEEDPKAMRKCIRLDADCSSAPYHFGSPGTPEPVLAGIRAAVRPHLRRLWRRVRPSWDGSLQAVQRCVPCLRAGLSHAPSSAPMQSARSGAIMTLSRIRPETGRLR